MVLVNYSGREINAKIVYYGPGLSGKTTNLEYIYGAVPSTHRGKMVSMKTKTERTLFFDFLPIHLGELSGFKTRFLLYTVPGQVYYNATRKLVLKGVDAVVFVADSQRGKMDENIESLANLRSNLEEHGLSLDRIPWIIQYNKRDLPDVYSIEELERVLNPRKIPSFEGVATSGQGVFEAFKAIARMLLKHLSAEIGVNVVASPGAQQKERPATPAPEKQEAAPAPEPAELETTIQAVPPEVVQPVEQSPPEEEPVVEAAPETTEQSTPPPIEEPAPDTPVEDAPTRVESRPEGVGDRLRRWLTRSRRPDDGLIPDHSPEPAALEEEPTDLTADQDSSQPQPEVTPEPPPEVAVPEPQELPEPAPEPMPEPQPQEDQEPHPQPAAEFRFESEELPEPEETPEPVAEQPEPETEKEEPDLKPIPLSVAGLSPEPQPEPQEVEAPATGYREIPVLVDLDPEDLQAGVVLKLRIAVRRTGNDQPKQQLRFREDRVA